MVAQQELEVDGFHYYPSMGLFHGRWNIRLTPGEAKLCAALMMRPGHVMSAEGLLAFIGTQAECDQLVKRWVSEARKKIFSLCGLRPIRTSRGYGGYYWQLPPQHQLVPVP